MTLEQAKEVTGLRTVELDRIQMESVRSIIAFLKDEPTGKGEERTKRIKGFETILHELERREKKNDE